MLTAQYIRNKWQISGLAVPQWHLRLIERQLSVFDSEWSLFLFNNKNWTAHGMSRSIISWVCLSLAHASGSHAVYPTPMHCHGESVFFRIRSPGARLRTHVQLIHNKPKWSNLFIFFRLNYTATMGMRHFRCGMNTYCLHIWLNSVRPHLCHSQIFAFLFHWEGADVFICNQSMTC